MYSFEVDAERRLVVAAFTGEVTDTDLFGYLSEMLSTTNYGAGWHSYLDFTNVGSLQMTPAGVEKMRFLPPEMEARLHGARAVIVAHAGSAAFGMARMYEMLGDNVPYQVAVLSNRDEAMAWLYARG